MSIHQPIPTQFQKDGKQYADGFLTPTSFDSIQKASFAPRRVIPIIFLPGIMGSHLRMSPERQKYLEKEQNVAWRPDSIGWALGMIVFQGPKERQLALDPDETEVDSYDPENNPTGNENESADDRHDNIKVTTRTPLLLDDPKTAKKPKTAKQKARERGWGEIYFDSYGTFLNTLEERLNLAFVDGKLNPIWNDIIGVDPATWQLDKSYKQEALTEDELRQVMNNCFYPVHAFGYNWLQSNGMSGKKSAARLTGLMDSYMQKGFRCEKVILITHSMGGLVARAISHPQIGNQKDNILGIVHGVMPAIGAPAAYRRMLAGFESGGMIASRVLGHNGPNVTAVLANAPGGLELAPAKAYGKDWLHFITKDGKSLRQPLPESGNPYEEIYPKADNWWGLLREQWINPAKEKKAHLERTKNLLIKVEQFHELLSASYHDLSYAHYGCDPERPAFQKVVWEVPDDFPVDRIDELRIVKDSKQGQLHLALPEESKEIANKNNANTAKTYPRYKALGNTYRVRMLDPAEPGDETVPALSADDQMEKGFGAIFRQTGYGHQDSYKDKHAIASSLYSIIRIAQKMKWKEGS